MSVEEERPKERRNLRQLAEEWRQAAAVLIAKEGSKLAKRILPPKEGTEEKVWAKIELADAQHREFVNALESAKPHYRREYVADIARIGGIPDNRHVDLGNGLDQILDQVNEGDFERRRALELPEGEAVFRGLRDAALQLKAAIGRLSADQEVLLLHTMDQAVKASVNAGRKEKKWVGRLRSLGAGFFANILVDATATLTDTSPYVVPKGKGSGRGRSIGSDGNWKLKYLVEELTGLIDRCGGDITHHDRERDKGKMLEVLNILRPFVRGGVIQNSPPLGTIQKSMSAERKKRL